MRIKNLILFTICSLAASAVHAKVCYQEALKAKSDGNHHLVISFEGLMSYNAGFVRKTLIRDLKNEYTFFSKNLSYTSVKTAMECIYDWENVFRQNYKLSIIGHSFGGGIATFELLEKIKNLHVDHVMTLDPRSWKSDSLYRKSKNLNVFKKPLNVREFYNLYQRGAMPGYKVLDATNTKLENTSHTGLPAHDTVFQQARCLLFEDC